MAFLIDPRAGGCSVIDGKFTRENCPKVVEWKAEQARSQRRAQLERTISEATTKMANGPVARTTDPGATALAAYLAIFGLKVRAVTISSERRAAVVSDILRRAIAPPFEKMGGLLDRNLRRSRVFADYDWWSNQPGSS